MPSEKERPASFPRLLEAPPNKWLNRLRQIEGTGPSIRVQFRGGRKIETTFDSQGRPVERQTTQLDASKYPSPAQFLPESPLRQ